MHASNACRRQRRTEFGKGAPPAGAEIFAAIGAYVPPAAIYAYVPPAAQKKKKPAVLRITLKSRPPRHVPEGAAGPVDGGPPHMASGSVHAAACARATRLPAGRRPGEHEAAAAQGGGEVRGMHLAESDAVRLRHQIEARRNVPATLDALSASQLSVGVLRVSGIALAVKPLQNDPDFTLSTAASALIARWKAQLKADKESRKEKLKEQGFSPTHTHTHTHTRTHTHTAIAWRGGECRRIANRQNSKSSW